MLYSLKWEHEITLHEISLYHGGEDYKIEGRKRKWNFYKCYMGFFKPK